jgi:type III secretion protein T
VAALALGSLRWLPAIVLTPIFAGHALSGVARTVLALALALPVAPSVAATLAAAPISSTEWLALAAKEASLGTVLACLIAAPFWAIEVAGTYLDYQRGGNPQALDPAASADASVLGAMLQLALVVYLMHTGGLHALLCIVWASYGLWPMLDARLPLGPEAGEAVRTLLVSTMQFALTLALPYLLALGAIEACFAALSRVNARFPAYLAALPFKSVALLLLVALSLPRLLDAASDIAAERTAALQRWMLERTARSPVAESEARTPSGRSPPSAAPFAGGAAQRLGTIDPIDAATR